MKQATVAASIFVTSLLLSSTTFAHTALKGEVMPLVPVAHHWTGFYAGLNAGAVNHTMNITDVQAATFQATIQQVSNPRFSGGFQVGYRYQLDHARVSGVYGLEFSTNFSNAQFKKEYGSPFALYQFNSENELQTICLLEIMAGIAADKTLLFLAAGLSWANISGSTNSVDEIAFFKSFDVSKKELGTALGGGIEYAFNDKISVRLKVDVITPNSYSTTDNENNSYQITNSIVQGTVGVNYKFA